MSKQNGGPAFPVPGTTQDHEIGMTLRDYFAAKAMPAIYTDFWTSVRNGEHGCDERWAKGVARDAYALADAMLDARTQEPQV